MTDTNVTQLVINELTKSQYSALTPQSNQLYLVTDEIPLDSSDIVATLSASSTNSKVAGAKAVVDYVASNPQGFLSSITSSQIVSALGYTPYSSSNPNSYISGITGLMVTTALGYTPYNSTNPSGYQTASDVTSSISTHNTNTTAHQDIRNAIVTTLGGLSDVSVSGATSGQFLSYNGTNWVPVTSSASISWGDVGGTLSNQTDLQTALNAKQDALPSGTTGYYLQKTANGVTWSEVQSAPPVDNISVSLNQSSQLQATGTINQNGAGTAVRLWTGTTAEYNAIANKDSATLYNITGDSVRLGTTTIAVSLPSQSSQSGKFLTTNGSSASWGTVDMSSRLDTDVSNITSTGKETLTSYGTPDYTAGVTVSLSTDYTIPKDGMILMSANNYSYNGDDAVKIMVKDSEGTELFTMGNRWRATNDLRAYETSLTIPVEKDMIVYCTGTNVTYCVFYPYKGVA